MASSPRRDPTGPDPVSLWNDAAGQVHPIVPSLWSELTRADPSFEAGDLLWMRPALETGPVSASPQAIEPGGFALTKRFRQTLVGDLPVAEAGYISLLAVHPSCQRQGLGRALLAAAERHLREQGAQRAILGGSFFHAVPGVPEALPEAVAFFERAGYAAGKTVWDLARDVREFAVPPGVHATLDEAGIEARVVGPWAAMKPDPIRTAALLEFLAIEFPGRWLYDIAFALGRGDVRTAVVTLFDGGKAIGFAQIHASGSAGSRRWQGFDADVAAIGPVGVARAYQGRGLGLAVVALAADVLRRDRACRVVIDWTDLLDFYGRLGFAPWLSYRLMDKALQPWAGPPDQALSPSAGPPQMPEAPPASPERLLAALSRELDLGPVLRVSRSWAGANSHVCLFETPAGRWCAKGRDPTERSPQLLAREHRIVDHLVARGFPTPAVLRSPDGSSVIELDGRLWAVYREATGEDRYGAASVFAPFASSAEARSAGAMLARFHLALAEFPEIVPVPARGLAARYELAFEPDLHRGLERQLAGRPEARAFVFGRPDLEEALAAFDRLRSRLPAKLATADIRSFPFGLIHGDWIKRNLFFAADDVSAVVDFDLACHGPWAYDLALAMTAAAYPWADVVSGASLRIAHADAMRKGYEAIRPLTAVEHEALGALLSTCRFEFHLSLVATLLDRGCPDDAMKVWDGEVSYLRWWLSLRDESDPPGGVFPGRVDR